MKRILAFLLSLALVLSLAACGGSGNPASKTPDSETFSGGDGTEANPYQISSAQDLFALAEMVNHRSYDNPYKKAFYVLTADVDLGGKTWTPIGSGYLDSLYSFTGIFDGQGHTISGLKVKASANSDGRHFGLFDQVEGTVKNLTLANSVIDASAKDSAAAGGIAGNLAYGIVENCHVAADVTVTGSYTTGGVVGQSSGQVTGCSNAAAVTGTSGVGQTGGVVGQTSYDAAYSDLFPSEKVIVSCSNTGTVQGSGDAGGVVGSVTGGEIHASSNSGAVSGVNAGGITGLINGAALNENGAQIRILNSENTGMVSGADSAGGISAAASVTWGNIQVDGCANTGSVTAVNCGGILGIAKTSNNASVISVSNCTNAGAVTMAEGEELSSVGGILGVLTAADGGEISLSGCENTGEVRSNQYAGGVLAHYLGVLSAETTAVQVRIEACANGAPVSGGVYGTGGIAGCISAREYPALTLTLADCRNSGDVTGTNEQAGANHIRIGGILGVLEPHHASAQISGCINAGTLAAVEFPLDEDSAWMGCSVGMGGILGYVGSNSIQMDPADTCGLSGDDAVVTIADCSNTGAFRVQENSAFTCYQDDICAFSAVEIEVIR